MLMMKILLLIMAIIGVSVPALSAYGENADATDVPVQLSVTILPDDVTSSNVTAFDIPSGIATANNRFALNFYQQVLGDDGNIFFSPLSMYAAFSMLYEGAMEETADQMQDVFGFEPDKNLRHNVTAAMMLSLNQQDPNATLTLANSLWLAAWFTPYDSYTDIIRHTYQADVESVDFSESGRMESVDMINSWAANKTHNKIPSILGPNDVHNKTSSVLLNAIYFKGSWEKQFEPELTVEKKFWTGSQNVTVDFMHMRDRFDYAKDDSAQILRMPYTGDRLSMLVILPSDRDGLGQLETAVTAEQVGRWLKSMYPALVTLQIPKFEVKTHYELNGPLTDMGMMNVFNKSLSDLSGMAYLKPDETLSVERAIQDAYVNVNEEGTEAAAVTAIIGFFQESVPLPPIPFIADHPFLFLILDDKSETILFVGRVSDPSCTVYDPLSKECEVEYDSGQ